MTLTGNIVKCWFAVGGVLCNRLWWGGRQWQSIFSNLNSSLTQVLLLSDIAVETINFV